MPPFDRVLYFLRIDCADKDAEKKAIRVCGKKHGTAAAALPQVRQTSRFCRSFGEQAARLTAHA